MKKRMGMRKRTWSQYWVGGWSLLEVSKSALRGAIHVMSLQMALEISTEVQHSRDGDVGVGSGLLSRAVVWDGVNLDPWAVPGNMRFSRTMCWVLHFGHNDPRHLSSLGKMCASGKGPEVAGWQWLNKSQQCPGAKKTDGILACTRNSVSSRSREVILPLSWALVRSHPISCVQFWTPHQRKTLRCWSMSRGEHCCWGRAWSTGPFRGGLGRWVCLAWRKKKVKGDLTALCNQQ